MDRAAATRLVQKLRALADPKRGGTPAECRLADEKAEKLIKRFSLRPAETQTESPRPRTFTAPQQGGAAWSFDIRTGAHSPNVKVEHWNSPRDWKIEIPL